MTPRRSALIAYLRSCIEVEDWHAISDAANDLRELDAEERGGRSVTALGIGERFGVALAEALERYTRRWSDPT